jgi:hypothetical protein
MTSLEGWGSAIELHPQCEREFSGHRAADRERPHRHLTNSGVCLRHICHSSNTGNTTPADHSGD